MVRNERQPRTRNGQPHQRTTGVARSSSSQRAARAPSQASTGRPSIGPIARTTSGTVSAAPTAKRRRKSTSSGFGPSSAGRHALRLQRHAADRAVAGADLLDLRVHRAGVDRARGHRLGRRRGRRDSRRVGLEPLLAARRAEVEPLAARGRHVPRGGAVDLHAADRVGRRDVVLRRRREPRRGSARSRSGRCGRRTRAAACRRRGRPSCRRPGPGSVACACRCVHVGPLPILGRRIYAPSSNWKVKGPVRRLTFQRAESVYIEQAKEGRP